MLWTKILLKSKENRLKMFGNILSKILECEMQTCIMFIQWWKYLSLWAGDLELCGLQVVDQLPVLQHQRRVLLPHRAELPPEMSRLIVHVSVWSGLQENTPFIRSTSVTSNTLKVKKNPQTTNSDSLYCQSCAILHTFSALLALECWISSLFLGMTMLSQHQACEDRRRWRDPGNLLIRFRF